MHLKLIMIRNWNYIKKIYTRLHVTRICWRREYTIDVFLDFDSNPITIVPRLRLATRSGEISKGLIVKHRIIIDTIKNMMDKFKFIGHITVQLKIDKEIKIY